MAKNEAKQDTCKQKNNYGLYCFSLLISLSFCALTEFAQDSNISLKAEYMQNGGYYGQYPQNMNQQMPQQQMPPQMQQQMQPAQYGPPMMQDYGQPEYADSNAIDPNDPIQQALSLHQAGRYADAIQIYESIIINNTPDPRIYASIADAHFRLGNLERSLKYCVEALKIDPNYASGHLLLGTILGEMGDMIRAIRSYERVISLDQNNPYAYYNLGLLYYKKSDIKTALEYLERARDLNPNDARVWNNLGVAYYDNAQFTKAAAAYTQALSLDPGYVVAQKNMELVRDKIPAPIVKAPPKKVVKRKAPVKKKK